MCPLLIERDSTHCELEFKIEIYIRLRLRLQLRVKHLQHAVGRGGGESGRAKGTGRRGKWQQVAGAFAKHFEAQQSHKNKFIRRAADSFFPGERWPTWRGESQQKKYQKKYPIQQQHRMRL